MGGNPTRPAHSPPPVIEHAPSNQMPIVDRGMDNLVAVSTKPSDDTATLDPLLATLHDHEVRADALITGPTEADGPSNETIEELVIHEKPTTARPQGTKDLPHDCMTMYVTLLHTLPLHRFMKALQVLLILCLIFLIMNVFRLHIELFLHPLHLTLSLSIFLKLCMTQTDLRQ